MAGTATGGIKAAATNKKRYGMTFYKNIGKEGGLKSRGGGFAKDPVLAREAGRKGGQASRRSVGDIKPASYERRLIRNLERAKLLADNRLAEVEAARYELERYRHSPDSWQ